MKSNTKYLFISLTIRNGEYEYTSISVHEISSRKSVKKFGRDYAKNFYGGKSFKNSPEEDWYYFNCGEVAVKLSTVEQIKKEEYDVLNKFQFR